MSSQIEDELRATFEAASDFVQPRPGLADRVRARSRRHRRRRTAALVAATACMLVAAGGFYVAVHSQSPASAVSPQGPRLLINAPRGEVIFGQTVSGRYLYVEVGPQNGPVSLVAYDRASGRLVRRFGFPKTDLPELTIGPGGSVWVVGVPINSPAPTRVWLLSPDLRLHSAGPKVPSTFLLPVSRTTALVPIARGLVELRMPAPGMPGHATEHLEPGTSLGHGVRTTALGWAKVLDGRVAVDLADIDGYDYHVVIAGHPSLRFGDNTIPQSATVAAGSLWLSNGSNRALVRLNGQLQPTTPRFVTADPVLRKVQAVWSADGTIWVSTGSARHSLLCFAADSQHGPVVTVHVRGYVWGLPAGLEAATSRTVYVSTARSPQDAARTISSYPVPAACR